MKITVEFESLKEFKMFMSAADEIEEEKTKQVKEPEKAAEKKQLTKEELNEGAKKTAEIINEAEAKEEAEKAEKEKKKVKAEKPKAIDYDALRVECRKVLAELNKVTGKNTASEMIKSHGAEKLMQVEDEFLPELLEEAKEALNNAK